MCVCVCVCVYLKQHRYSVDTSAQFRREDVPVDAVSCMPYDPCGRQQECQLRPHTQYPYEYAGATYASFTCLVLVIYYRV